MSRDVVPAETPGRGRNGRYTRTEETAARDARAARLRSRGLGYQQIADAMGYENDSGAWKAVQRALDATVTEPGDAVRKMHLTRLDDMYQAALRVLETQHLTVSVGKVVTITHPVTGERIPVPDDAPALAALDRMLRIEEQRAKLLGSYAPPRIQVSVVSESTVDAEIRRLEEELSGRASGAGRGAAGEASTTP